MEAYWHELIANTTRWALRLHFSDEDGKKREKEERDYLEAYHYNTSLQQAILLPPHKAIGDIIWRWGINNLNFHSHRESKRGILLNFREIEVS